jgi:hypothetical protein
MSLLFHLVASTSFDTYVSSSGSSLLPAELQTDLGLWLIKFCVVRSCKFVVWRPGAYRSVWLCYRLRTSDKMDSKKVEIKLHY